MVNFHIYLLSADFFKNQPIQKILLGIASESQFGSDLILYWASSWSKMFQSLSADNNSRLRFKTVTCHSKTKSKIVILIVHVCYVLS